MKLQMQPGSLRLRLAEAELAQLLLHKPLHLELGHGQQTLFALELRLGFALHGDGAGFELDIQQAGQGPLWRMTLPASTVTEYARTLPRRDALAIGPALPCSDTGQLPTLLFEVDVRDSARLRKQRGEAGHVG